MSKDKTSNNDEYLSLKQEVERLKLLVLPTIQNRFEDRFNDRLNHDIKNKLIKISHLLSGISYEIENEKILREHLKQKIDVITKNIKKEISSIAHLQDFRTSKFYQEKELVDLNSLIRFIISNMEDWKGKIDFIFENKSTPNLLVDKAKLFMVIDELFKNSIDAIFEKERNFTYGEIFITNGRKIAVC